jgi:prepilin-type N-terminal cleavage/methylation domain-containing protein
MQGKMRGRTVKETQTRRSRGFSLIELLIVVAIILIIAAIAIPNLLRAKIAANEASAATSIRKIATAEVAYSTAFPTVGYAPALSNLGGPATSCSPSTVTACILDSVLSGGTKSGYQFVAIGSTSGGGATNTIFVAGSAPIAFNQTGVRSFCSVTDGVLRSIDGGAGAMPANSQAVCVAYPITQ